MIAKLTSGTFCLIDATAHSFRGVISNHNCKTILAPSHTGVPVRGTSLESDNDMGKSPEAVFRFKRRRVDP